MLGNGFEMSLVFRRILGPLVLGWAPNHFVLGAQLALGKKTLVCIPGLIIDKLAAYGLSDSACSLLQSYLSDRKQMVKLGHCKSTFLKIIKGVPQESILGPQHIFK